jgi:protein-histidine pros-kinase
MADKDRSREEIDLACEEASVANERFLVVTGHELRTPLNAIIGFTGTVLMRLAGPLTVAQDEQLQIVRTSAKHLLALINDLLDVAKIESGCRAVDCEAVTCQHVLSDVADALRSPAEAKGLTIELSMPAQAVFVRSDRRALDQLLFNLTSHAIMFTERGFVRLEIDAPSAAAGTIEIRVVHNGTVIQASDEELLFQAFAPFIRGSDRYHATGLGLHLSRQLAELLGGSVRWTNEMKNGSAFVLSLPRH